MDFAFSPEQEALREVARRYLAASCPPERVLALSGSDPGWDASAWPTLAGMGWLDGELGPLEHAVLLEEAGRALLPAPLFSTLVLAGPALARDPTVRARVAGGELRATLAWAEAGRPQGIVSCVDGARTTVDADGGVSGHKVLVPDAAWVDAFVVVATGADGAPSLRLVAAAEADVTPRATVDVTRRLGDVDFDAAPSLPLADGDGALLVLRDTHRRALAGVACEAAGVASWALAMAADHAKLREQFGRVIGTYQGVSHRVADVYMRTELARSLAIHASWAAADGVASPGEQESVGHPDVDVACAAAKAVAAEAAVFACESAIQVLGGIGFTWEHPLHRWYKRALWLDAFQGSAAEQRKVVADALFGPARKSPEGPGRQG